MSGPAGEIRVIDAVSPLYKKHTGSYRMKNKSLGGDALEKIMRDVLEGLQEFSHNASLAGRSDSAKNGRKKKMMSARIINFPKRSTTN